MKKILLTTIFLIFSSYNLSAETIAILDIEKIVKESVAMKDIQTKVTKKQKEYQEEVDKEQKKLEQEKNKIEEKKKALSKEALEKEITKLEGKIEEFKKFVENKQSNLKKASIDGVNVVNEKVKEIITNIAKDKSIDVVLPSSQVLYSKDGLDISNEVLTKLNKSITTVKIKFE